MSNVFFTADLHLGHKNVIQFEDRPFNTIEEHDRGITVLWNSVIGHRDVVWVLGDLAWSGESLNYYLPMLNGRKRLVMGNHDTFSASDYLDAGIESIHGMVSWKKRTVLTHAPVVRDGERYQLNLHGHIHSNYIDDPHYLNVGVDRFGMVPVSWEHIKDNYIND